MRNDLYNVKDHAESRQSFEHAILALNSAILTLRLFAKHYSHLPWCLLKSGSDCCENAFSRLGGCGSIGLNRSRYNMYEATQLFSDYLLFSTYEHEPGSEIDFGRLHDAREYDFTHDDDSLEDANFMEHLTDIVETQRARDGLREAQALACWAGMDLSSLAMWNKPWVMLQDYKQLAIADDDEDVEQTTLNDFVLRNEQRT